MSYLLRRGDDGRTQVLLGRKKKGLGLGNFVGLGGKLEPGETTSDAAVREIFEESGLHVQASDLVPLGRLRYWFPHREAWSQESSVFVCSVWSGTPTESDELKPEWFDLAAIPLSEMWDDAKYWLLDVLDGKPIFADFTFGADLATVVEHSAQFDQPGRECQDHTGPNRGSRITSESPALVVDHNGS